MNFRRLTLLLSLLSIALALLCGRLWREQQRAADELDAVIVGFAEAQADLLRAQGVPCFLEATTDPRQNFTNILRLTNSLPVRPWLVTLPGGERFIEAFNDRMQAGFSR